MLQALAGVGLGMPCNQIISCLGSKLTHSFSRYIYIYIYGWIDGCVGMFRIGILFFFSWKN